MIRFLLVFGFLELVSRWEPVIEYVREPYCEILARSLGFVLTLGGLEPQMSGSTIVVGFGNGITVVPECDGLVLLILFASGVAGAPIQRTLRPYVWAGGFLMLLVIINWFRIAFLAMTGFYKPDLFGFMHIYVIQGLLILAVLVLLLAWFSRISPEQAGAEPASP